MVQFMGLQGETWDQTTTDGTLDSRPFFLLFLLLFIALFLPPWLLLWNRNRNWAKSRSRNRWHRLLLSLKHGAYVSSATVRLLPCALDHIRHCNVHQTQIPPALLGVEPAKQGHDMLPDQALRQGLDPVILVQ